MYAKKFPNTCHFWEDPSRKCFVGEAKCPYIHNYICQDDGHCKAPKCNYAHVKQNRSFYLRDAGPQRKDRSPRRYIRSPHRHSRSPRRHSKSPRRHSRSPQRYSRSPRRYSRSPRKHSRSPHRHSRSPYYRSKSSQRQSRSSRKYSRSPRKHSRSRSYSRSRSGSSRSSNHRTYSPSPKCHRNSRSQSPSPQAPFVFPTGGNINIPNLDDSLGNLPDPKVGEMNSQKINIKIPSLRSGSIGSTNYKPYMLGDFDISELTSEEEHNFTKPQSSYKISQENAAKESSLLYENFDTAITNEGIYSASNNIAIEPKVPERKASFSPSSHALEIIKCLPKDFFNFHSDSKSEGSSKKDPLKEALLRVLNKKDNTNLEKARNSSSGLDSIKHHDLTHSSKEKSYPSEKNTLDLTSGLWRLPHERNQSHSSIPAKIPESRQTSNWEIDTPYISRNKPDDPLTGVSEKEKEEIFQRLIKQDKKPNKSSPLQAPTTTLNSNISALTQGQRPENADSKKRRYFSSSSSSEDEKEDNNVKEEEPPSPSKEFILEQKRIILSKVWKLMEQKKKLDAQRENIVQKHKSDPKKASALLIEIDTLRKEVDRKIYLMNASVREMNVSLGLSLPDTHGQSFLPFVSPINTRTKPSDPININELQEAFKKEKSPPSHNRKEKDKSRSRSPRAKSKKKQKKKSRSRSASMERSSKSKDKTSKSRDRPIKTRERSRSSERNFKATDRRSRSKERGFTYKEKPKYKSELGSVMFPEPKAEREPKSKMDVRDMKESSELRIKSNKKDKEKALEKEYAPSTALKPHIRFLDQGFHWCKLCNNFFDSAPLYIKHLSNSEHLNKLNNTSHSWLPKPAEPEKKEDIQPGAHVLTIPLQGMEFMHSIPTFYCSLCTAFIYSKEEATIHCETNLHVSRYKEHLSKNPLYESSYNKDKMAAFAEFSVAKQKNKINVKLETEPIPDENFTETPAEEMKDVKDPVTEWALEALNEAQQAVSSAGSSIRVASRNTNSKSTSNEKWVPKEVNTDTKKKHKSKNGVEEPVTEEMKIPEQETLQALKNSQTQEAESSTLPFETPTEEEDKSAITNSTPEVKKAAPKIYKNVLIGKMPFLNRKATAARNKSLPSDHTMTLPDKEENINTKEKSKKQENPSVN